MSQNRPDGVGILPCIRIRERLLVAAGRLDRGNMKFKSHIFTIAAALLLVWDLPAGAQQIPGPEDATDDSTIVYPSSYFAEFLPVSVNDMLNRIPGINLAMRSSGGGGGSGRSRGRRGLGSGEGEVLINGQRVTGKNSGGRDQLNRISADQVDYIEIIRGTSEELDVRGGGQVVNVVMLDVLSTSSTTVEIRSDRSHDGTIDTGGQLSYSGQSGDLNYLLHVEASPRYNASSSRELSYDPDYNLQEIRYEDSIRDELEYQVSANVGYRFDSQVLQLNGLYETRGNSPSSRDRSIHDLVNDRIQLQREDSNSKRYSWEVGGDYERDFAGAGTYRFLFIVNDREFQFTRNRFDLPDAESKVPNLFLHSLGRDQERIARTSYTFDMADQQGLEIGVEGAQTIRDSGLQMGLNIPGERSPAFGNLVPVAVDNSGSKVEEVRYEGFAVHNWRLNPRMSLESSMVMETSTIEQTGDVFNSRDFEFVRPKVDYRFDITPSLQLRARIEKDVQQLSFSDFSASTDNSDDDQNTRAGNPDIRQQQSWRYELNLEMRLPNNLGVVNSQLWFRDIADVIERVDVSPGPDDLRSARGNIGDGTRYGLNLDLSTRLPMLGMPNALLTTGIRLRDSEIIDPFLGQKRRMPGTERWSTNVGFRNDMVEQGLTYGMFYAHSSNGGSGRTEIDIIDIEERIEQPFLTAFVEKKAFENFTFRLESRNITESEYCRRRTRFLGATADGIVEEIEHYCNGSGMELAFRVSATF